MKKSIFRKILGFLTVFAILLSLFAFSGCSATEYQVFYLGNGNTSGSEPVDDNHYQQEETAIVLGNTGNLEREGFVFAGWNTNADGTGTDYAPGSEIVMNSDKLLYAKWEPENPFPYYARLVQVNLKTVETGNPEHSVSPVWDLELWGAVKLNKFSMTFGKYSTELPKYTFKQGIDLQQGVFYDDITELDATDLPIGEYTEFPVNSNANYFTRVLSAERTLSFRASFYIENFAKPDYPQPEIIESIGTIGGSTLPIFETQDYPVPEDVTEITVEFNDCVLDACGFKNYSVQFVFNIVRGQPEEEELYNVTYDGNGATQHVPTDNIDYYYGSTATVKPQGSMVFPDHYFIVWNTAADGSGTDYEDGDAILMTQNITLYAQWTDAVTANIMGKTIKDAELNGSTYNAANSIYITEDYSYGMEAWLYVDTEAHSTLKISEFARFDIIPAEADVIIILKKDSSDIGYDEEFVPPATTSTQINIEIQIKQGNQLLDAVLIHVRKLPL